MAAADEAELVHMVHTMALHAKRQVTGQHYQGTTFDEVGAASMEVPPDMQFVPVHGGRGLACAVEPGLRGELLGELSLWAIPTAITALLIHTLRLWLLDRRLQQALAAKAEGAAS